MALVLTEGESYTIKLTVTNRATKAGQPTAANLDIGLLASTEFTTIIPSTRTTEHFPPDEARVFDYDMVVPIGSGGENGQVIARVFDPAGNVIADVFEPITIESVAVPVPPVPGVSLASWYAGLGLLEIELLDLNGKIFSGDANTDNVTISGGVVISSPRQISIRWRNVNITGGFFRSIMFLTLFTAYPAGAYIPRYIEEVPVPAIGSIGFATPANVYYGDAGNPEILVDGKYDLFLGVYGIMPDGFMYGIGGVNIRNKILISS